jgi:hypothetical protein
VSLSDSYMLLLLLLLLLLLFDIIIWHLDFKFKLASGMCLEARGQICIICAEDGARCCRGDRTEPKVQLSEVQVSEHQRACMQHAHAHAGSVSE